MLKQKGSVEAQNPVEERILADIAAAGFARKEGNVYVNAGTSAATRLKAAWGFVMPTENRKKLIWAGISCVPQLIVCLMLLWALKPDNRYGYYVLLRWACCAAFAYLAFQALAQGRQAWGWVLGVTAVAYNPIIPIHLTRNIWSTINVMTIGLAVASIFVLRTKGSRRRQSDTGGVLGQRERAEEERKREGERKRQQLADWERAEQERRREEQRQREAERKRQEESARKKVEEDAKQQERLQRDAERAVERKRGAEQARKKGHDSQLTAVRVIGRVSRVDGVNPRPAVTHLTLLGRRLMKSKWLWMTIVLALGLLVVYKCVERWKGN
ncbi:MAG TPA: DUF6804 family protein, partial [Gemmataceae bacterium]|nr:DUF6804 family protein [Gemmataceae bacterium]